MVGPTAIAETDTSATTAVVESLEVTVVDALDDVALDDDDDDDKKKTRIYTLDVWPGLLGMYSDFFGLAIIAPLLPEELTRLNRGAQWVGYVVTGQYTAVVIGSFLMGAIADYFGQVVALSLCMLLDAVLFAASGFAPTAASLLAMRCLVGLFAPQGLAIAWISSVSTPETLPARMGAIAGFIHLGIVTGTAIGGLVPSWIWACLLSGGPPLVTLGLIALYKLRERRPEQQPPKDDDPEKKKKLKRSTSLRRSLRNGMISREFAAVFLTFFANGMEISIHFALLVVVLTERYGLSRFEYSMTLIPASFIQMFNHFFLLPILIKTRRDPFILMAMLTGTICVFLCFIILITAVVPDSPWPLIVVQNVAFWGLAFTQGVGNFASATHAAFASPDAKGALIGLGRSAFNLGTAVGPTVLIALYLKANVRISLAVNAALYACGCVASILAVLGDPAHRPPSYFPSRETAIVSSEDDTSPGGGGDP